MLSTLIWMASMQVNYYNSVVEVLWTFSIYLESVAMVPQVDSGIVWFDTVHMLSID